MRLVRRRRKFEFHLSCCHRGLPLGRKKIALHADGGQESLMTAPLVLDRADGCNSVIERVQDRSTGGNRPSFSLSPSKKIGDLREQLVDRLGCASARYFGCP